MEELSNRELEMIKGMMISKMDSEFTFDEIGQKTYNHLITKIEQEILRRKKK